jgi:hypothetical protein
LEGLGAPPDSALHLARYSALSKPIFARRRSYSITSSLSRFAIWLTLGDEILLQTMNLSGESNDLLLAWIQLGPFLVSIKIVIRILDEIRENGGDGWGPVEPILLLQFYFKLERLLGVGFDLFEDTIHEAVHVVFMFLSKNLKTEILIGIGIVGELVVVLSKSEASTYLDRL